MKKWRLFDKENVIDEKCYSTAKKIMKGKVIVIADDNGGILKWLKFSLEDYGAIIHTFEHGNDTVDFVQNSAKNNQHVNILMLDLIMNEIGGIEIAKRSKEANPQALILFITGCSKDSEEWLEASKLGIVIQKPVGIEDILATVIENLNLATSNGNKCKQNSR